MGAVTSQTRGKGGDKRSNLDRSIEKGLVLLRQWGGTTQGVGSSLGVRQGFEGRQTAIHLVQGGHQGGLSSFLAGIFWLKKPVEKSGQRGGGEKKKVRGTGR